MTDSKNSIKTSNFCSTASGHALAGIIVGCLHDWIYIEMTPYPELHAKHICKKCGEEWLEQYSF